MFYSLLIIHVMEIRTKIKRLLRQQGLSQNEISAEFGMTRQNFYNKMIANSFTSDQLEKLAKRLGVSVSFLTDQGKENISQAINTDQDNDLLEIEQLKKEKQYLETIISEMKARIVGLEDFLQYLKKQHKGQ